VLYCVGFLAQYLVGKGGSIRVILSLVASGMVASSSSLLTLLLAPIALLVRYSPFRAPWYINLKQTKRIAWVFFVLVVPLMLVLLFSSGYREVLTNVTVSKGESGSFINRTAADLYSLQLLLRTYGLGVGLGSNRSSGLLTTLISNVGLGGVLAFLVFYFKLFANLPEEYAWLKWAGFAFLLNMCLGIADITMPLMWCPILLAIQFSLKNITVRPPLITSDLTSAKVQV
jgi:tetrahydromethanopterin S-methyltransferase subunit F